jgi:molybdopterin synthase catalytic subunit
MMYAEFRLSADPLDPAALSQQLDDPAAGGIAIFEGRVRGASGGVAVAGLDYETYPALCLAVGREIVSQEVARLELSGALAVHRHGNLAVGERAIWVGVAAAHRAEAFAGCMAILERIKHELPVWKRERLAQGGSRWIGGDSPSMNARKPHEKENLRRC